MAFPCREPGCHQPRRTGTRDQDFLRFGGRSEIDLQIHTCQRVHQTADRSSDVQITQAGLCAADAGQDLFIFFFRDLIRQVRIGDGFAAERDEIRASVQQGAFRDGGFIAADGNDRDRYRFFDHPCRELVESVGHGRRSAHVRE